MGARESTRSAPRLATTWCRGQLGLAAPLIEVQVYLGNGLPTFSIVGLPAAAVRESKERVRAALEHCGFPFPAGRITVNLAPADLPKDGGRFDLPIAIGILLASGQLPKPLPSTELYGELSLSGELRPVRGLLLAAVHARRAQHSMLVPDANLSEVLLVAPPATVLSAMHLKEVCALLRGEARSPASAHLKSERTAAPVSTQMSRHVAAALDVRDVRGQHQGKRALLIAAAGAHSLLFYGPPGAGKSMLAQRLPALLPPLTLDEALEVASIAAASHSGFDPQRYGVRPFRAPHHTASAHAIIGGGPLARPGEVSLSHNGVLFLDELPEFDRRVLEGLREPLECGYVAISRARVQSHYPAAFQLIAAMNPCPCGEAGGVGCRCTPGQIRAYRSRLSSPLLDRIDLHVELMRARAAELCSDSAEGEGSAELAAHVVRARARQLDRAGKLNSALTGEELRRDAALAPAARALLERAFAQLRLTARGYHRILRVARTIADLTGCDTLDVPHVAEAVQLRRTI